MPGKRTHYEVMGLPRSATPEQIKRKYRQLVRRYHPDVAVDKAAAKAAFIEISDAYETLSNPDKRTIYDASLDAEMFRVDSGRTTSSRTSYRPTNPYGSGQRPRPATPQEAAARARRLVEQAEASYRQSHFGVAERLLEEAQHLDRRNAKAYWLLGDVYRKLGRMNEAATMYTVASQLDPQNREIMDKLNRTLRQQGRVNDSIARAERYAALKIGLSLMGFSMGAFMFVMLAMDPGRPIDFLRMNLPMVGTWSTSLITTLLVTGMLMGFLLSVNENVDPIDEELLFNGGVRVMGVRRANYPVGLILLMFNLASFYAAVAMYTVVGMVQDSLSKSVYKSFVATFALVLVAALVYTPGRDQVLWFAGNVAFPAVLFGWAIGDMFRPGF